MKIRVFDKIVEFDEKNPGIQFFLEECCEFPTESWFMAHYSRKRNNSLTEDEIRERFLYASTQEIRDVLKNGIIESLEDAQEAVEKSLEKEIEDVRIYFE